MERDTDIIESLADLVALKTIVVSSVLDYDFNLPDEQQITRIMEHASVVDDLDININLGSYIRSKWNSMMPESITLNEQMLKFIINDIKILIESIQYDISCTSKNNRPKSMDSLPNGRLKIRQNVLRNSTPESAARKIVSSLISGKKLTKFIDQRKTYSENLIRCVHSIKNSVYFRNISINQTFVAFFEDLFRFRDQ